MDIVDGVDAEAEAPVYGELSLLDGETFNFLETDGGHASETDLAWRATVSDLDLFFSNVYGYYAERGLPAIVAARITNLVSVGFTVLLSTTLFAFLDWATLLECKSESTCKPLHYYLDWGPLGWLVGAPPEETTSAWWSATIAVYFATCSAFWLWNLVSLFPTLRTALEMSRFFRQKLRIDNRQLQTVSWDVVVQRLAKLQRTVGNRIQLNKLELTAHDVATRIMRKENFLIAMIDHDVLHLPRAPTATTVAAHLRRLVRCRPCIDAKPHHRRSRSRNGVTHVALQTPRSSPASSPSSSFIIDPIDDEAGSSADAVPSVSGVGGGSGARDGGARASSEDEGRLTDLFLSRHLEWNVKFCIMNHIFNDRFRLKQHFVEHGGYALRRRFIVVGALNLLLSPFLLIFVVVHFLLRNAEEFHSKRNYLGPRDWTPLARWRFREYNELPHRFDSRINRSYKPADSYIVQFPTPSVLNLVARCASFIAGAIVAVLLLFSMLDEHLLLSVSFGGKNLLWFLAIFSTLLAISRSLIPQSQYDRVHTPAVEMRKVFECTHFLPDAWKGRAESFDVRDSFLALYPHKAILVLQEILSIVVTPFILMLYLPRCAGEIVEFVQAHSTPIKGLGHICTFALFDFERHGDPRFGALRAAGGSGGGPSSPDDTDGDAVGADKRGEEGEGGGAAQSVSQPRGRADGTSPSLRARMRPGFMRGKMEKSLIGFAEAHPGWRPNAEGVEMLASLSASRSEALAAAQAEPLARSLPPPHEALSPHARTAVDSGDAGEARFLESSQWRLEQIAAQSRR